MASQYEIHHQSGDTTVSILEWVYAYPPGIPLIYPGEEITRELLCRMQKLRAAGVSVKGMQDQKGEHILCIK